MGCILDVKVTAREAALGNREKKKGAFPIRETRGPAEMGRMGNAVTSNGERRAKKSLGWAGMHVGARGGKV